MKRPDFKYHVITFLELPYKDIDKYVCIPWSWVRIQRATDRKVVVSYPVENPSDTEKRVKKRQRFSKEWGTYMAFVKYSTDVYEDAKIIIKEMIHKEKSLNITHEDRKFSKSSEKKSHESKSNHEKMDSMDTTPEYIPFSKCEDKSAIKLTLKRKPSVKPSTEVPEQSKPAIYKDIPTQKSCTQEKSNNRESINKTAPETSTQNRASVDKDSSNQEYQKRSQQEYFTDFLMLLTKLHVSFAEMHSMFDQLREAFIHNAEVMVTLIKTIEDSRASSNNAPAASSSNNNTPEVTKVSARKESEQIPDDDCDDDAVDNDDVESNEPDDDNDDDFEEIPIKRKRIRKSSFVIPPEYDKKDSRWTLKYREAAPGLVELMPHTEVYINEENFNICKTMSKDFRTLARMLLVEIFTINALCVCSFTGAKPKDSRDIRTEYVRPGLDEHARTVLLTYVEDYSREMGWRDFNIQSTTVSLRNKMHKMRIQRRT